MSMGVGRELAMGGGGGGGGGGDTSCKQYNTYLWQ